MTNDPAAKRTEYIAGLREFADLLETDPTIPTPNSGVSGTTVWAHIMGSENGLAQDERFELIHDFADAHDVKVTEDHKGDRQAEKRFGPINFHVCAYADKKPEAHVVTRPNARRSAFSATAA